MGIPRILAPGWRFVGTIVRRRDHGRPVGCRCAGSRVRVRADEYSFGGKRKRKRRRGDWRGEGN